MDLLNLSKYAIVKDGVVINIVVWDGDTKAWQPPPNTQAVKVDKTVLNIGDNYKGA